MSDERLSKRDAEVLDSLYGERPRAEEDDELSQLTRLRSVFAELREHQEEPPPAGMALLMAAARQAAEERQSRSLWARLRAGLSMMMAHPAMSAVAAAVLVVGVGGFLLVRGVVTKAAAPTVTTAPSLDSTVAPVPLPAPAEGPAAPVTAAEPPAAAAPAAAAQAPASSAGSGGRAPDVERKTKAPVPAKVRAAAKDEAEQEGVDKRAVPPSMGLVEEKRPPAPKPADRVSEAAQQAAPPPPPPPAATKASAAKPRPVTKADDAQPAEGEAEDSLPGDGASTGGGSSRSAERWYQLAKAAAAKGECEAVKVLAERVRSEDPGFFDKRFRADLAIKKCL
jgi:hypothetical protein